MSDLQRQLDAYIKDIRPRYEDMLGQAKGAGADGFMRKTESLDTLFREVSAHLPVI